MSESFIFIDGIGISGYRSFGSDIQRIGPFQKINLFIGQNNSGKSNILSFFIHHYTEFIKVADRLSTKIDLDPIERHIGIQSTESTFSLPILIDGDKFKSLIEKANKMDKKSSKLLEIILKSKSLTFGDTIAWLDFEMNVDGGMSFSKAMVKSLMEVLPESSWRELFSLLTQMTGGTLQKDWIKDVLAWIIRNYGINKPEVNLIPAIRRVEAGNKNEGDLSGIGIIERLAKLEKPDYDQQHLKKDFDKINKFLREVTGNDSCSLEIPFARDKIIVQMDEKTLPLSSIGMGFHEVIIIASAATLIHNQVICIEEPEIHLHPILQKKLITYLYTSTDNQYLISTHSAHLLDTPGTAIFHVYLENGQSRVIHAITDVQKSYICADLGYKASDLLQANCVIWVEGPSDRIYLNHWISSLDPTLTEGIHYSIMFYGGRLLSHLSANDPEVDEFISLRRLNRYITIVMDSDFTGPHMRLKGTKKRVYEEFNKGPGFAWVTKGREIENYVPYELLKNAIHQTHPNAITITGAGQYSKCYAYITKDGKNIEDVDKVKISRMVASSPVDLNVLDLRDMSRRLVNFIHEANNSWV